MKLLDISYSLGCYLFGVASLAGLILFAGDIYLPWTINAASPLSPQLEGATAIVANIGLVTIWSLQHSVMADPGFKRAWTRIVPAHLERSTYVLFVGLFTFGIMALWSPLPGVLWDVSGSALGSVLMLAYLAGWVITLISTFLINHSHLFGLQQAFKGGGREAGAGVRFVTPLFYKLVRHPMMTGVLIALWSVPTLTVGRLTFNLVMSAYILLGTRHEEETLVADLGEEYEEYRKTTPMLIPTGRKGARK